jgi:hypothetical protein
LGAFGGVHFIPSREAQLEAFPLCLHFPRAALKLEGQVDIAGKLPGLRHHACRKSLGFGLRHKSLREDESLLRNVAALKTFGNFQPVSTKLVPAWERPGVGCDCDKRGHFFEQVDGMLACDSARQGTTPRHTLSTRRNPGVVSEAIGVKYFHGSPALVSPGRGKPSSRAARWSRSKVDSLTLDGFLYAREITTSEIPIVATVSLRRSNVLGTLGSRANFRISTVNRLVMDSDSTCKRPMSRGVANRSGRRMISAVKKIAPAQLRASQAL